MNINLTLFAQSIAFFLFAYLCWRYIWPALLAIMEERRERIEQGLADAESAKQALESSKATAAEELAKARTKADGIIGNARDSAASIEQEGREQGRKESERVVAEGRDELSRLELESREGLRGEVAGLVFEGVERIVGKSVDRKLHDKLVDELIERL